MLCSQRSPSHLPSPDGWDAARSHATSAESSGGLTCSDYCAASPISLPVSAPAPPGPARVHFPECEVTGYHIIPGDIDDDATLRAPNKKLLPSAPAVWVRAVGWERRWGNRRAAASRIRPPCGAPVYRHRCYVSYTFEIVVGGETEHVLQARYRELHERARREGLAYHFPSRKWWCDNTFDDSRVAERCEELRQWLQSLLVPSLSYRVTERYSVGAALVPPEIAARVLGLQDVPEWMERRWIARSRGRMWGSLAKSQAS